MLSVDLSLYSTRRHYKSDSIYDRQIVFPQPSLLLLVLLAEQTFRVHQPKRVVVHRVASRDLLVPLFDLFLSEGCLSIDLATAHHASRGSDVDGKLTVVAVISIGHPKMIYILMDEDLLLRLQSVHHVALHLQLGL